jgi:hypothetical protein
MSCLCVHMDQGVARLLRSGVGYICKLFTGFQLRADIFLERDISSFILLLTERRGRVVSTPASYSGDPGFIFRLGNWLS